MQLFCSSFESYVEETVEIWNSLTSEDLQNARNAYAGISSSGNYEYSQWKYNYGNISNLLATKWNQQDPYNSAIKAIKGQNYPAGCGTTAVAQIMAFHEFPKTCDETIKNTLKNNWSLANSWDGTYNWNLLKSSSYVGNLSAEGKIMLGALMYENAEGLKADYSITGTNIKYINHVPYFEEKRLFL